jgi:membrane fusion protein, copper/silver efflux system
LTVNYVGAEVVAGQPMARLYSRALLTVRDEYLLLVRQTTLPQRDRLLDSVRQRLVRMGMTAEQIEALASLKTLPDYVEILAPRPDLRDGGRTQSLRGPIRQGGRRPL